MKTLYSFKVKKPSGGEVELAVRKPTRMEMDEADMLFSAFMSECIAKGILTKEMMLKAYKNFGGAMSEKEVKQYNKFSKAYYEVIKKLETVKSEKTRAALEKERDTIWLALSEINNEHEKLFSRTADAIAQNKTILHLALLLGLEKKGEGDEATWEAIFKGADFEERYESYSALEETSPEDADLLLGRISTFVMFWYFSEKGLTEEDFKQYDRLMHGNDSESNFALTAD